MVTARCGGQCDLFTANLNAPTAIVFGLFLAGMAALFWWGARRRRDRTSKARYEFDELGRAHRVPHEQEYPTDGG